MTARPWASLFSGGKDSTYAYYLATERGLPVDRLVTVHPPADSFLYHVPATDLAALAADSIGLELTEVASTDSDELRGLDSGDRGDAELRPLEAALKGLCTEVDLAGITAGAVESAYQADRLEAMCGRLDIELFAPLWGGDPTTLLRSMLDDGFEIIVIRVAAAGLDASWLGRSLDTAAIDELAALADRYGVHPMGEGGEYETLVTDGPHMRRPIRIDATPEWEGSHGTLRIEDAWLE